MKTEKLAAEDLLSSEVTGVISVGHASCILMLHVSGITAAHMKPSDDVTPFSRSSLTLLALEEE